MTKPPPRLLVALVFILILVMRVHHAWVSRFSTDADRDIAQLMCKHVAEGREWPVFFYGQSYMGSLEPLCGALFCKLFGTSSFTAALGTAIPSVLIALFTWLITRAMAGPWAALYAAAFFVTCSPAFSAYMANPRGGYSTSGALAVWCLYLGALMACREFRREPVPIWWYAALGLLAGAAWWTSAIVVSALVTAALMLLVGLRGRVFKLGILAGLGGFLVGAAPWLIWNAQNKWDSLSMSSSVGAVRFKDSVPWMLHRVWDVAGLGKPDWSPGLLAGLLLVLAVTGLVRPVRDAIRQKNVTPLFFIATVVVYTALFIATYVSSSFARIETLRYLLPLVPVLAILTGLVIDLFTRRLPWPIHVLVLIALISAQLVAGQYRLKTEDSQRANRTRAMDFGAQAKQAGYDAVFAWYGLHWINFASGEAVPVIDPNGERYVGYARQGLLAERPAWLSNPNGLSTFLQYTASPHQTSPSPLGGLIHSVLPPNDAWTLVDPSRIVRITAQDGTDLRELVADGNLTSKWRGDSSQQVPSEFVVQLNEPTTLRGLKLYSAEDAYPLYMAVDGRTDDDASWLEIQASHYVNGYHWSGPLIYWENLYYTVESRFEPVTVRALRIRFPPSPKRPSYRVRLAEITLLADDSTRTNTARVPPNREVEDLLAILREEGTTELLANRWVSDRLAALTSHVIRVRNSADLSRTLDDSPQDDVPIYTLCDLTRGTALLIPPGATATLEKRLEEFGYRVHGRDTSLGRLLLLNDPANAQVPGRGPMAWFGDILFAMGEPGDEMFYAQSLYEQSKRLRKVDPIAAQAALDSCLAADPKHVPALRDWLAQTGPEDARFAERKARLHQLTEPTHPASVRFSNGMRLEGCTVEPPVAPAGSTVTVYYYWRAPAEVKYDDLNVFVHFRNGRIIWQDDHPAFADLAQVRIQHQLVDTPLVVTRQMVIPEDAPPGSYDLVTGLIRKSVANRVMAFGRKASWNRSIRFQQVLVVTPPKNPPD